MGISIGIGLVGIGMVWYGIFDTYVCIVGTRYNVRHFYEPLHRIDAISQLIDISNVFVIGMGRDGMIIT